MVKVEPKKILIVRFSSFGDIIQALAVVAPLRERYPNAQIDWITKTEFTELVRVSGDINRLYHFDKRDGIKGLFNLAKEIKKERYDLIYDAHNNLRSLLLKLFLMGKGAKSWITRPKSRFKRFLLFKLRINKFPKPFKGMLSFIEPLNQLGVESKLVYVKPNFRFEDQEKILKYHLPSKFITLVPSAAWEMKRWPIEYWKKLIALREKEYFVILGGPNDHFCEEFEREFPDRVKNLAGELSLIQSACLIERSNLVISADTGLLHVADLFGKKAIALIGPTAFGFPTGKRVKTLETSLPCRPCSKDGRGSCSQKIYQKCLVEITPEIVSRAIDTI